jgi:uncharacterized protein YecA (UPF0149 family)
MTKPIPFELQDPEMGQDLIDVVQYNSKVPKRDRIVVDFINESTYYKTIKSTKIGRNDPCPCGSGLKYKKCCEK